MKKLQTMKTKKESAVKLSTVDDVFAQTQRVKPKRIADLVAEEEEVVREEKKPSMDSSRPVEPDTVERFLDDVPEQFTGKPKLTTTNDSDDVKMNK